MTSEWTARRRERPASRRGGAGGTSSTVPLRFPTLELCVHTLHSVNWPSDHVDAVCECERLFFLVMKTLEDCERLGKSRYLYNTCRN